MSEESSRTKPFAYTLIIESEKDLRWSALQTITSPNCAVDVAQDEDEAVHKALQHRVKLHQTIEVDPWNPSSTNMASYLCCRAHLSRAVRLVTHSDGALTVAGMQSTNNFDTAGKVRNEFANPPQIALRPQCWQMPKTSLPQIR